MKKRDLIQMGSSLCPPSLLSNPSHPLDSRRRQMAPGDGRVGVSGARVKSGWFKNLIRVSATFFSSCDMEITQCALFDNRATRAARVGAPAVALDCVQLRPSRSIASDCGRDSSIESARLDCVFASWLPRKMRARPSSRESRVDLQSAALEWRSCVRTTHEAHSRAD